MTPQQQQQQQGWRSYGQGMTQPPGASQWGRMSRREQEQQMQQYQAYQAQMAQFMAMAMQGQQQQVAAAPAAASQRQGPVDEAARRKKDGSATTLLVKRLPDSVSDGELRKYFAQFGRLVGFEVDRSRHLAFVQFPTPEQAERALKKPKPVVSRRFLTVVMAKGDPLGPPPPATEPKRFRSVGEPLREALALLCEVKEVGAAAAVRVCMRVRVDVNEGSR